MTPERFDALIAAYGADPLRWPEHERGAALALAARLGPTALDRLADAAPLDAWLAEDPVPGPDEALTRRILAGAPAAPQRTAARVARLRWWRPAWSWPAGLAGAGLAGSLAGVLVASSMLRLAPPPSHDVIDIGTAFTAGAADWSEE